MTTKLVDIRGYVTSRPPTWVAGWELEGWRRCTIEIWTRRSTGVLFDLTARARNDEGGWQRTQGDVLRLAIAALRQRRAQERAHAARAAVLAAAGAAARAGAERDAGATPGHLRSLWIWAYDWTVRQIAVERAVQGRSAFRDCT